MKKITVPWKPHPKERPRATKGGVIYTPRKTKDKEKELRDLVEEQVGPFDAISEPCGVQLIFEADKVEISIYTIGEAGKAKLRGDIDNYAKTVLDALNGLLYEDDRHIVELSVRKY